MKRGTRFLTLLLALSLSTPLAGSLLVSAQSQRGERAGARRSLRKMTEALSRRAERARAGSGERERVILRVEEGRTMDDASALVEGAGGRVGERLD